MSKWVIKVSEGPLKGQIIRLVDKLSFGRRKALINLKDPNVSSVHAKVSKLPSGKWVLEDNDSRNGTKVFGKKIDKIALSPGVRFQIGSTHFEVLAQKPKSSLSPTPPPVGDPPAHKNEETFHTGTLPPTPPFNEDFETSVTKNPYSDSSEKTSSAIVNAPALDETNPDLKRINFEPKYETAINLTPLKWPEALAELIQNTFFPKTSPRPVFAFDDVIELIFFRGVQTGTHWTLGYGPRVAGSEVLQLSLFEPDAPKKSFSIAPTKNGAQIQTDHPEKVFLNEKPLSSEILNTGDIIRIGETEIEVQIQS